MCGQLIRTIVMQDLLLGLGGLLTLQTSVNKNRKKEISKTFIFVMWTAMV